MPLLNYFPKKSKFTPSKWEKKKVNNLVMAIKAGRLKLNTEAKKQLEEPLFDIWDGNEERMKGLPPAIPPSKMQLPGNEESYNPPQEYLLDEEEEKEFDAMDPEEKEGKIKPKRFLNIRSVPAYSEFIKERFSRCLDLYLAPRLRRKKLDIKQEALLPKLPSPSELKPFPSSLALRYKGLHGKTHFDSNPNGEFLCAGDEKGKLILFESLSGFPLLIQQFDDEISEVTFSPLQNICLVAWGTFLSILQFPFMSGNVPECDFGNTLESVKWEKGKMQNEILRLSFKYRVKTVSFHRKGDYFSTTSITGNEVLVHKLSNRSSQRIFGASKGGIFEAIFHPNKPQIFLMSNRNVYLYSLLKSSLVKKLVTGVQVSSAMDVHHSGDHVIVGAQNQRVLWFDLDLDDKPFKVMKYHDKAVGSVCFHLFYHLFATGSHDSLCFNSETINVFHGRVSQNLGENALIVPVKVLRGHSEEVVKTKFHSRQPWLFSSTKNGELFLWI